MIRLREGLMVSAHMIVSIELSVNQGKPCIDVTTPDGAYWSIGEECGMPINQRAVDALAAEVDRQCREIGAAAHMTEQVKRAIGVGANIQDQKKETVNSSRYLDDDIPF